MYIGRATSLMDRVKSYFSNDLIETRGPRIVDMVTKSTRLTFVETDSVLEAIILESNLIKKYQPKFNVDERDDKSSLYIVITNELWPRVFTVRERDFDKLNDGAAAKSPEKLADKSDTKIRHIFGPYPHAGLINESLKILRKIFPFKDKKSHDPRHEAFYNAIGRSPDSSDVLARRRYLQTIRNLVLFLNGQKITLVTRLEREMKICAKAMKFEEAQTIKRTLYALKHINDIALIKNYGDRNFAGENNAAAPKIFRMEAYDIAHLSGSNTVGAMVVSVNGEFVPSEYRKFKISRDTNNDVANLAELLSRRLNHSEWSYPDLIVVDGNDVQARAAEAVLSARRINIPVVAVTKDERHRARAILGSISGAIPGSANQSRAREIVALNAEAHRFVLAYHRKLRRLVR